MSSIPIPANSEDFCVIQFLLQVQLQSPQFKLGECFDIGNQAIRERFAEYVGKMATPNVVDVFVSLGSFNQPVSDIVNRGVKVNSQTGLRFRTNHVSLDSNDETHEILHLVVALGQVMNFEIHGGPIKEINYDKGEPSIEDIPSRYDSLRIGQDDEFVVFDATQVKACHLLKFRGGDNLSHESPKFDPSVLDGESKITDGLQECPEHPGNIAQYYDPRLHAPVCLECKINGSHSRGEPSRHKLVPIVDAFNEKRQNADHPQKVFTKRRKAIEERGAMVDKKLNDLDDAEAELIKQINLAAQKAIEEAHKLYDEKAVKLHSAKVELERKRREAEAIENIVNIHRDHSPPLDFLRSAFATSVLTKEIREPADLPLMPEEMGEIVILQNLEVGIYGPQAGQREHQEGEHGTSGNYTATGQGGNTENRKMKDPTIGTALATKDGPHVTTLSKMALRKKEKYIRQGTELDFVPFEKSNIISEENHKKTLFYCLPFKATPTSKLLFSSVRDGRSISVLHKKVDGMGVTVLIIKSGDHIFGGFASNKWNTQGKPFGEPKSSFLFSLDKDAFIPCKLLPDEPICLYADEESLTFGKYDLAITGNFDMCRSKIENNYGIGLEFDSRESQTFLAGSPVFKADVVEVWGFFSNA